MKEFFMAAFPWLIMGICLAIAMACGPFERPASEDKKETNCPTNKAPIGMLIGMSIGAMFSYFGLADASMGISLGMLIGTTIGCLIKSKC